MINAFSRTAFSLTATAALFAAVPAAAQTGADGQDRRVLIENQSSQTILYVRGSPTSDPSFGPDRIPDRVIAAGQSSVVDFDSGSRECLYDLRVTMADGSNVDRMNVDVCRVGRWTIGARGNDLR